VAVALIANSVSRRAILPLGAPLLQTGTAARPRVDAVGAPGAGTPPLRLLTGMTMSGRDAHDVAVARPSQPAEDVSRASAACERAGRLQAEARAAAAEERAAVADWLVARLRGELIGPERNHVRWWCPWSRRALLWRRPWQRDRGVKED